MLSDIQANPTALLNPSNHHHSTTKKPNISETHEQSNTFSTKISKVNILFENLTRKIERSKRFGFEKDKVLLWNNGDYRSCGFFGRVMVVGKEL